jgi:hypothetical protein
MPVASIKYLCRAEIDPLRWDQCIGTAPNGLIYAYSFYLDQMTRHWDALVLNDYEAVMPLPWNRKWGIAYLYQPPFIASLGVFGKNLTGETVQQMLDAIPKKFRLIEIDLNHSNTFNLPFQQRVNYVLDLNKPYDTISANYNDNLQRNLKKANAAQLKYRINLPVQEVIQLAKEQLSHLNGYKEYDYINFHKLFSLLHLRGQAMACGVFTDSAELTASAAFFFSHNRAYYILVGNRADKRTEGASHYLIDRFIYDHAGKPLLFDFEGSDIEGLANFYASFGAQVEKYPTVLIDRLPWMVKALKL